MKSSIPRLSVGGGSTDGSSSRGQQVCRTSTSDFSYVTTPTTRRTSIGGSTASKSSSRHGQQFLSPPIALPRSPQEIPVIDPKSSLAKPTVASLASMAPSRLGNVTATSNTIDTRSPWQSSVRVDHRPTTPSNLDVIKTSTSSCGRMSSNQSISYSDTDDNISILSTQSSLYRSKIPSYSTTRHSSNIQIKSTAITPELKAGSHGVATSSCKDLRSKFKNMKLRSTSRSIPVLSSNQKLDEVSNLSSSIPLANSAEEDTRASHPRDLELPQTQTMNCPHCIINRLKAKEFTAERCDLLEEIDGLNNDLDHLDSLLNESCNSLRDMHEKYIEEKMESERLRLLLREYQQFGGSRLSHQYSHSPPGGLSHIKNSTTGSPSSSDSLDRRKSDRSINVNSYIKIFNNNNSNSNSNSNSNGNGDRSSNSNSTSTSDPSLISNSNQITATAVWSVEDINQSSTEALNIIQGEQQSETSTIITRAALSAMASPRSQVAPASMCNSDTPLVGIQGLDNTGESESADSFLRANDSTLDNVLPVQEDEEDDDVLILPDDFTARAPQRGEEYLHSSSSGSEEWKLRQGNLRRHVELRNSLSFTATYSASLQMDVLRDDDCPDEEWKTSLSTCSGSTDCQTVAAASAAHANDIATIDLGDISFY